MNIDTPAAIIDKSLLQRICDPSENCDRYLNALRQRYRLIAPLVLHEETLDNLVRATESRPEAVFPEMVRRVREIQPCWMEDVLEISYRELVLGEDLDIIPWLTEEFQRFLWELAPADPKALRWVPERRRMREEQISRRIQWQRRKVPPGEFFLERDEGTFFRQVTNLLLQQLSRAVPKADLLETFIGNVFVHRHPENASAIHAALRKVDDTNINDYKFSRNYLISSLVYLIGPITKVLAAPHGKQQPLKILDRQDQRNNLEDQEYVASAFLCARLLTGDAGMAKVMGMFQANGLWPGRTIWLDRKNALREQIPALLV
jgi:hypothetical protein